MKTLLVFMRMVSPFVLASQGWALVYQETTITAEVLASDDITIQDYALDHARTGPDWIFDLGVGSSRYALDYTNILFGSTNHLETETVQANLSVTRKLGRQGQATLGVRGYDGFSNYRSLWLAEYYRELWSAFPDYRNPEPKGQAATLSGLWHFRPGSGLLEAAVDFGRDRVTPAWAFDSALGRPEESRERLNTVSGQLRAEQALTGWLKTELSATYQETSEREVRLGVSHSWAASAGRWAARLSGGYSEEGPNFESVYGGVLVEYDFLRDWTLTTRFRAYHDTGEIAESNFTASAPALDSTETHLGMLWAHGQVSVSLGVAFLDADYKPLSTENSFFGDLYKDRAWVNYRAAFSLRF